MFSVRLVGTLTPLSQLAFVIQSQAVSEFCKSFPFGLLIQTLGPWCGRFNEGAADNDRRIHFWFYYIFEIVSDVLGIFMARQCQTVRR